MCVQSSWPSFVLLCEEYSFPPSLYVILRIQHECGKVIILETILTNQNCIHEGNETKSNSENACNRSAQNALSSCLLYKNVNTRTYKTVILPVILYGYETRCLRLRKMRVDIEGV
jgi:hypothetical protein